MLLIYIPQKFYLKKIWILIQDL